jgi:NAD(P)-dependent dehydrogenase (short-subunit alcohol dehydrogenase family)
MAVVASDDRTIKQERVALRRRSKNDSRTEKLQMPGRLENKITLITGAGMGMGREAALLFAREGARVVVADLNGQAAAETVDQVKRAGGEALATVGDVAVEAEVKRMVEEGVRRFGALHVLYNNAGVLWKDRDRSVLETDGEQWDRVMGINLKSVFWVTKYGIPHLRAAGGGSIILVGSVSALAGFTRAQDAYTAAKGALISLNKSLAIQFAKDNIRSNVIHPGIVETPLQAPYLTDALRAEFKTGIPLGRIGQPRDIANAALFLASDESSFMTGAEMIIDGGFMAQ